MDSWAGGAAAMSCIAVQSLSKTTEHSCRLQPCLLRTRSWDAQKACSLTDDAVIDVADDSVDAVAVSCIGLCGHVRECDAVAICDNAVPPKTPLALSLAEESAAGMACVMPKGCVYSKAP